MRFKNLKLLAIAILFICCTQEPKMLTELFELPGHLKEASALEITPKSKLIWTLEDHGNKPKLYALDDKGKIVNTLLVTNAENRDWEALASDDDGDLYIGDFGNNDNERKDLCIYKIDRENLGKPEAEYSAKISFYYPEQQEFPPKKSERYYDAEAFFYYKGQFYLFTKNRSGKSGSSIYTIPATEGNHAAKLIGEIPTCEQFRKCAITDADISDDGKKVVLLSNQKIWVISNFNKEAFAQKNIVEVDLNNNSQLEGVCFKGKSTLYFVDEKDKGTGGKVYEMKLKN